MFQPTLQTKANGMPVISSSELDVLGERMLADFSPLAPIIPQEVDIDRFLLKHLGMKQDFHYLSHCGVYLGMTVFQTTHRLPVYNPDLKRAEYVYAEAGTIIIDSSLAEEAQEHRYRFTVGHECAHAILHTSYFLNTIGSIKENAVPYVRCRADYGSSVETPNLKNSQIWTDERRAEQQANRLCSAILMPKSAVRILLAKIPKSGSLQWTHTATEQVSKTFNVSTQAAFYRLKELGFIESQQVLAHI